MSLNREVASWEETQRQLIAQDHDLLENFQVLKYINVGLLAVLIYDYCLTFNLEKTRIWTLRWRLPKILFMINRYFLPPFLLFEGFSNVFHVGQKICNARLFTFLPTFPAIMTVELILILRVLALYENSKYMARYLIIQFIAQFVLFTILTGVIISKSRSIAGQDAFTGCLLSLPNGYYLAWVVFLVSEIILAVLAVYKCREYGNFSPTIKILARDSVVYFVSLTVVIVFNLFYTRSHSLLGITLTLPTNIIASIAAARLTMNIRSITMERALETLAQESVQTIMFLGPESVSHEIREEEPLPDVIELDSEDSERPRQDEEDTSISSTSRMMLASNNKEGV